MVEVDFIPSSLRVFLVSGYLLVVSHSLLHRAHDAIGRRSDAIPLLVEKHLQLAGWVDPALQ